MAVINDPRSRRRERMKNFNFNLLGRKNRKINFLGILKKEGFSKKLSDEMKVYQVLNKLRTMAPHSLNSLERDGIRL